MSEENEGTKDDVIDETPSALDVTDATDSGSADGGASDDGKVVDIKSKAGDEPGDATDTDATKEGDDAGEGDDTKATQGAPEKYELKVPEGVETEGNAAYDAFLEYARENGMTNEQAQRQLDREFEIAEASELATKNEIVKMNNAWAKEWMDDPDIGGEHKDTTLKSIAYARTQIPEVAAAFEVLNEMKFGNHPAFVKAFAKVGRLLQEDSLTGSGGDSAASGDDSREARARKVYSSMG